MSMKAFLAGILLLLAQDAKDDSKADVDGPYVFEGSDGWAAHRIVKGGAGLVAKRERVEGHEVLVPIPGRDQPLKVKIRASGDPPSSRIPMPEKILALSDIEGNLGALIGLLRAGGVIGEDLAWRFGKGHVVCVGDVFDRGLHVTECLWLLYELEGQAAAAGGAVHFVLGNHEVMNLTGDLRYVRNKYRENAALLEVKLEHLYARTTVLGRWLRSRNAVLRVGDEIFVHGGISPAVADSKVPLGEMNDALRRALLADSWTKPREGPAWLAVDGKMGLTWYRGYLKDPIDERSMDVILAAYGAKRVIVGHTIVKEVGFTLGGRVLAIDVHHADGKCQAALFENGAWHRLGADGKMTKLD